MHQMSGSRRLTYFYFQVYHCLNIFFQYVPATEHTRLYGMIFFRFCYFSRATPGLARSPNINNSLTSPIIQSQRAIYSTQQSFPDVIPCFYKQIISMRLIKYHIKIVYIVTRKSHYQLFLGKNIKVNKFKHHKLKSNYKSIQVRILAILLYSTFHKVAIFLVLISISFFEAGVNSRNHLLVSG